MKNKKFASKYAHILHLLVRLWGFGHLCLKLSNLKGLSPVQSYNWLPLNHSMAANIPMSVKYNKRSLVIGSYVSVTHWCFSEGRIKTTFHSLYTVTHDFRKWRLKSSQAGRTMLSILGSGAGGAAVWLLPLDNVSTWQTTSLEIKASDVSTSWFVTFAAIQQRYWFHNRKAPDGKTIRSCRTDALFFVMCDVIDVYDYNVYAVGKMMMCIP